ncbi:glycosyl hydrolase family 61-domain-containing protein [Schizophyllum commune]
MKTIALLSLAAALLPSIAAKGYVSSITIDGTEYKGPSVGDDSDAKSAIRSVSSASAIKGASNPDIACGPGSKAASEYASAKPGSKVEVQWVGSDGGAWEDKTGPLISYIALCPLMECRKLKATDAKWAKIDEVSIRDDKTWAQEDLANGNPATLTLPEGLAAGAYLLRHEIISLSNASTEGGADFYASCAQIKVEHGGDGAASDDELVSFPGAYSDSDAGILIDASSLGPNAYPYPGLPIAAMAQGSADSGPSSMALPPAVPTTSTPSVKRDAVPTQITTTPAVPTQVKRGAVPTYTPPDNVKRDSLPPNSAYDTRYVSATKRAIDPQCSTFTCDDSHHAPGKREGAAAAKREGEERAAAKREENPAAEAAKRLKNIAQKLAAADLPASSSYWHPPGSTVTDVPGKRRLPPGYHGF